VFPVEDKIDATIKKLNLWWNYTEKEKYDSFDMLSDFLYFCEEPLYSDVAVSMIEHMKSLASQLRLYFPLCPEKKTTG
jgi:hypothetical protein